MFGSRPVDSTDRDGLKAAKLFACLAAIRRDPVCEVKRAIAGRTTPPHLLAQEVNTDDPTNQDSETLVSDYSEKLQTWGDRTPGRISPVGITNLPCHGTAVVVTGDTGSCLESDFQVSVVA